MPGWNLPEKHTIGDLVQAVLGVDNPKDAKDFFENYVSFIQKHIDSEMWEGDCTAEQAARSNIGWCFGEGMAPDRVRMWVEVCQAMHPFFGTAIPTPTEAFEIGKKAAQ